MIKRLSHLWGQQFARFLAIGAVNTFFGWSLYSGLLLVHIPRAVSLLIATVAGVLFNFQTTGRVVFGDARARLLPRFIAAYCAVYLFNLGLLEFACRVLLTGPWLGQALALAPTVVVSYAVMQRVVFERVRWNHSVGN